MLHGTVWQITTYFLGVCLLSIALLVFVSASTTFVVTDVIEHGKDVGNEVGTLAFADELVAMIACPFWGWLSDQTGARTVIVLGYAIIAVSLVCLINANTVYPGLLACRMFFSLGGAAVTTMVAALLPMFNSQALQPKAVSHSSRSSIEEEEHSNANTLDTIHDTGQEMCENEQVLNEKSGSDSFRIAGLVGTAAGCGALLALLGFLRLPPFLQERNLTAREALRTTYYVVASAAFLGALVCTVGLRGITSSHKIRPQTFSKTLKDSLYNSPVSSLILLKRNNSIFLAYLGGFVARASSVGISLFIPLWVNDFFVRTGECKSGDSNEIKFNCKDAYVIASILTGTSQLAALLFAPVYGFTSAKWRLYREPLILASSLGILGYCMLSTVHNVIIHDHSSALSVYIGVTLLGLSQIGVTVCSLGLLGQAIVESESSLSAVVSEASEVASVTLSVSSEYVREATDQRMLASEIDETGSLLLHSRESPPGLDRIKGSISGTYSFFGGVAILLLTKLGGLLFDEVSRAAPFILMACFNVVLFFASSISLFVTRPEAPSRE